MQSAPSGQQRFLQRIFGIVKRAEDAVAVQMQLAAIWLDELAEGVLIASAGQLNQVGHIYYLCRVVAKYEPLAAFLQGLPKAQKQVTLSFKRLEELISEPLPPSALEYEQWWRGGRVKRGRIDANWQDQVQQRAWEGAGWTVEDLDLILKNVTFRRL